MTSKVKQVKELKVFSRRQTEEIRLRWYKKGRQHGYEKGYQEAETKYLTQPRTDSKSYKEQVDSASLEMIAMVGRALEANTQMVCSLTELVKLSKR